MPTEPWVNLADPMLTAIETLYDERPDRRWAVTRRGEREQIPGITRHLVRRRDGDRCTLCDDRERLEVDHIVPWSAGGPDTSDNLRMLCERCNNDRSNFREAYLPRVLPVVVVCDPCLRNHDASMFGRHERSTYWRDCPACWNDGPVVFYDDVRQAIWCGTCGATSWVSDLGRLL